MDLTLLNLDEPTETRTFERGRFELYSVGPMTIGRATYEPGWKWSEHVGAASGESSCMVEHVGYVVSGRAAVKMDDGEERVMEPGDELGGTRDGVLLTQQHPVHVHQPGADLAFSHVA